MASPRTALVVCGGGPVLAPRALAREPPTSSSRPTAAPDEALRLGLEVDVVVGDMDSVPASTLAQVERAGGRVMRHPADKDATDLELALDEALASQAPSDRGGWREAREAGWTSSSANALVAGPSTARRGGGRRGLRRRPPPRRAQ